MIVFDVIFAMLALVLVFEDFIFYRISNLLIAIMLGIFVAGQLTLNPPTALLWPGVILVTFSLLGFVLFRYRIMGAGDVKFLSVASAWAASFGQLSFFLIVVSLLGAVLALVYMHFETGINFIRMKLKRIITVAFPSLIVLEINIEELMQETREPQNKVMKKLIPYGVAVGLGCIILMITKWR